LHKEILNLNSRLLKQSKNKLNETIANAKPAPSSTPALIGRQDGFTVSQEIKVGWNEDQSANTTFAQTVVYH